LWWEMNFKDDKQISVQCWDEDGNEIECPERN